MTTTTVYKMLDLGRFVVVMEETTISKVKPVDTLLANLQRELQRRAGPEPRSIVSFLATAVMGVLKKRGVVDA